MKEKWTPHKISALKGDTLITALTAHDCSTARLVDEAGAQLVLVGDSLAMYAQGHPTTLPVTLDEMLYHARLVSRGIQRALIVADMPFLSYQVNDDEAMRNAGRFLKEARADAVKIEGGTMRAPLVKRLVDNGIPVLGHIGLTPQSIKAAGGYKVQGRTHPAAEQLKADALALEKAGVFALVIECTVPRLAEEITAALAIPVIGIGSGPACDGQILVTHDILGLFGEFKPKFVKRYANLGQQAVEALTQFRQDVENRAFPTGEYTY